MKSFNDYLNNIGEVGYVEEVVNSVAYVSGLPKAISGEVLLFENDGLGMVLSMDENFLEVLVLSSADLRVGTKVARTQTRLSVGVGSGLLGKRLTGLGKIVGGTGGVSEYREIDSPPPSIIQRTAVTKPLETGVAVVDLIVPIAKGQRELVIGDRNTGKTSFLHQVILNQARKGTICIYVGIGKKRISIKRFQEQFVAQGIVNQTIIIAASAAEPAGVVFMAPYTAMTIAEYFRDQGRDVLLVFDDMSSHAKYYREISLLTKRFPGRNSYPGDIFYIHSRLLERAGSFARGTITCLPVAESVLGDLSGYVQTNLMAMTDGHIYFDSDMMNEGKFPPVNPFLSVTRVGLQAQTQLIKDTSRALTTFLVSFDKLRQFLHFGAELTEAVRKNLEFGEKIESFFGQSSNVLFPTNLSVFILGCIWADTWKGITTAELEKKILQFIEAYDKNKDFKEMVDSVITESTTLNELIRKIKEKGAIG